MYIVQRAPRRHCAHAGVGRSVAKGAQGERLVVLRFSLVALLAPLVLGCITGCSTVGRMDLGQLVTGGRNGWQLPAQVVQAMQLEPGDRVAEIGAGTGYWLPWLAQAVGPEGRVYAVEVTDELVEVLQERVERDGLANVVVIRGQFEMSEAGYRTVEQFDFLPMQSFQVFVPEKESS